MNECEIPQPRQVELEKIQLAILTVFSDEALVGAVTKVNTCHDDVMHRTIVELAATVLGQRSQWCRFAAPATWWDHVKERFFPLWLKRRFPIRYREEIVEATAMLPSLALDIPGHRTTLFITSMPIGYERSVGEPWRADLRKY